MQNSYKLEYIKNSVLSQRVDVLMYLREYLLNFAQAAEVFIMPLTKGLVIWPFTNDLYRAKNSKHGKRSESAAN